MNSRKSHKPAMCHVRNVIQDTNLCVTCSEHHAPTTSRGNEHAGTHHYIRFLLHDGTQFIAGHL